jgi:hypothetical protein
MRRLLKLGQDRSLIVYGRFNYKIEAQARSECANFPLFLKDPPTSKLRTPVGAQFRVDPDILKPIFNASKALENCISKVADDNTLCFGRRT